MVGIKRVRRYSSSYIMLLSGRGWIFLYTHFCSLLTHCGLCYAVTTQAGNPFSIYFLTFLLCLKNVFPPAWERQNLGQFVQYDKPLLIVHKYARIPQCYYIHRFKYQ